MFLAPPEIAELTGIKSGMRGKTREVRQIEALRHMKIPHYVNMANRPIVARAVLEGGTAPAQNQPWTPALG